MQSLILSISMTHIYVEEKTYSNQKKPYARCTRTTFSISVWLHVIANTHFALTFSTTYEAICLGHHDVLSGCGRQFVFWTTNSPLGSLPYFNLIFQCNDLETNSISVILSRLSWNIAHPSGRKRRSISTTVLLMSHLCIFQKTVLTCYKMLINHIN